MARSRKTGVVLPPGLFTFLRQLAANNNRDWFNVNKARYEANVKEPLQAFVAAFDAPLRKISRSYAADPKRSIFRIHRDTRFSRDKSPYKTHAAAQFRHVERGREVHSPGFYLHLEPGQVFAAAGLWHPDAPTTRQIRDAIVADPRGWMKATRNSAFERNFEMGGESLKRPPRGFDPEHPLIEDLKRKDFIASKRLTQKQATSPEFLEVLAGAFKTCGPFVAFLARALGLRF